MIQNGSKNYIQRYYEPTQSFTNSKLPLLIFFQLVNIFEESLIASPANTWPTTANNNKKINKFYDKQEKQINTETMKTKRDLTLYRKKELLPL